ncbi:bifunctional diguanylate cyclase/phosphodiesterase [Catellatospora sp. KI3]|uniref:putative bifunctional diguanylate cyclase/phosphodiesterase n=1 Tax=Catellatospora sp. KI3 TaxID=3041620 RepID=UPI0024827B1C|nr:bifunctional diguanylate cyclase/phosphodiesterase [Catellatospora sp. KI3]MDI1464074.1 bifunctional diguanylate cyclase/phosphodiesterase [Catellatospora sp. KI3]
MAALRRAAIPIALVATAITLTIATIGQVPAALHETPFWVMTALALAAAAVTYLPPGRPIRGMVVSPSLCFTFAILLCWDLGPAIAIQALTVAIIAIRARQSLPEAVLSGARYLVALGAAYLVLLIGEPDPFHSSSLTDLANDTAAVSIASLVFTAAYGWSVLAGGPRSPSTGGVRERLAGLKDPAVHLTALTMLSPVLAVTGHVSLGFVPLVIVPLYAVQRMARLSQDRQRAAHTDALTGLGNRASLQTAFARIRADRPRHRRGPSLLLMDLDGFKYVNDALGHDTGDQMLTAVAQRLTAALPEGALAARLGGDEFGVLLRESDAGRARRTAEAISAAVNGPVQLGGLEVEVAAAVGVAVSPQHGDDFASLMRHADIAMYDAKRDHGGVALYLPGTDRHAQRLEVLDQVRHAISTDDRTAFALHYQPQADLSTGEIVGVEALLRWTGPDGRPVPPDVLISMIEHSPVMHQLTDRVIDDAFAQTARWRAAGLELRTSVNVSIRDLFRDDLVANLRRSAAAHRLPAGSVQLEITESALMADPTRAMRTIMALREIGVGLALDDFGTGFSSLQHLRRIPLDEIKIDKSFVSGMTTNRHDDAIVTSVIALARTLGLRTVAEGIEDVQTRERLRAAGCGLMQGWLLSPAVPAGDIPRLVTAAATTRRPPKPPHPAAPIHRGIPATCPS